ncbi:MAG: FMN-binding protein [Bacillota bacterium]
MAKLKKKFKILIIILTVIVTLIIGGIIAVVNVQNNLDKLNDIQINIDLNEVEDGTYYGSHSTFPVSAEVKVVVQNHMITEIEILEHIHGQGYDGESITDVVIEEQSLDVDAISGATFSSKVILLAIEDALN